MAFNRDSSLDIDLGTGNWRGGVSDGTTLWFVDDTSDQARAYVAATRARDAAKDISLGPGEWQGGASDGITLWFLNNTSAEAVAYVAATRARDAAKDISLGTGGWEGGVSDGTTLWLINSSGAEAVAYVAATRARDAAKDISLGSGNWQGGISDGTTLWFIKGGSDDDVIAYRASDQSRQASEDITHADLSGSLLGCVYANSTAWFVEPDADTAIAFRQTTPTVDHTVDAGAVSFAFHLPEPTVTHTPAPTSTLATSDWDSTGYQAPIVLALLPATISGSADITVDPVTAIDGDLVVASDLTIDGVERIGIGIRLRRTGTARLDFYFDDAGSPMYPDAKAFIVIDDTARTQIPFTIAATAGGFNNWQIDDAAQQALITAIATGDRFVLAIAEPAATTTDHAVDAGAVSWAFHLPEPTVTHTPAGVTVDHAVDAGAVHFVFHLPQPTVTHVTAAPTTDHAVDAGSVAWNFHLPQPSVTHSLPTGLPIWSQYAITINTDPITRFWTGRGRLDYAGELYEGGGRAVGVGEVELVSGNPDQRLTITLSSIPPSVRAEFLQDVGAVEVEVSLIFSVDRGATWRSAPLSYSGRLSSPTMVNGRLTVELETLRGDVDHGEIRYWSHEDQERRYPGDKGFEYMRQLAQKGTETGWPP